MTFVGKILVVLIMFFSVLFLAFSVVVFATEKNWKAELGKLKAEMDKQNELLSKASLEKDQAEKDRDAAKAELAQQTKKLATDIETLKADVTQKGREVSEMRDTTAKTAETLQAALREAESRKEETLKLRDELEKVQTEASAYKIQQTELNDQIRLLQRQLETATRNNADLRERAGAFAMELRRNGLSDDFNQIRGVNTVPPDVEGVVRRVDARGSRLEISIGSDDGLVVGHELEVYRTAPAPEYLGRIRIEAVDPDQAVASVIGKTVQGKKIQEGDHVAPKIRPRG